MVESSSPREPSELPPTVVSDKAECRCEWCGRSIAADATLRDLAADTGRKPHRYLPSRYRACGDECRDGVVHFVRRHLSFGPLLWTLAVLSFLMAVIVLLPLLPGPLRLYSLATDTLLGLLFALGLTGVATGVLVASLPYTFIARRPEGEPPVVSLRRAKAMNRGLGMIMATLSATIAVRVFFES